MLQPTVESKVTKLLLIDDSPIFVHVAKNFIQRYPNLVLVGAAETGQAGISLAEELQPDIVLLDIGLPDGSGLKRIPHLKKALPRAGIIVLTLHNEKHIQQEALGAGAEDFVTKSNLTKDLLPTIQRVSQAMESKYDDLGI